MAAIAGFLKTKFDFSQTFWRFKLKHTVATGWPLVQKYLYRSTNLVETYDGA